MPKNEFDLMGGSKADIEGRFPHDVAICLRHDAYSAGNNTHRTEETALIAAAAGNGGGLQTDPILRGACAPTRECTGDSRVRHGDAPPVHDKATQLRGTIR